MDESDSQAWVQRIRAGDSVAAQQLFDHYMTRLIGLVRKQFPNWLERRTSSDSTAASAVGDCLVGIREGRYVFHKSGDLWRLLTSIAINKLRERIRTHTQQKRTVRSMRICSLLGQFSRLVGRRLA
jgi:RNA polymerase sigma-70 factor (ECF subfamily)